MGKNRIMSNWSKTSKGTTKFNEGTSGFILTSDSDFLITDSGDHLVFGDFTNVRDSLYSAGVKNKTGFVSEEKETGNFSSAEKNATGFVEDSHEKTLYEKVDVVNDTAFTSAQKSATDFGEFTGDIYNTANEYDSDQYYNGKEIITVGTIFSGNAKERTEWS